MFRYFYRIDRRSILYSCTVKFKLHRHTHTHTQNLLSKNLQYKIRIKFYGQFSVLLRILAAGRRTDRRNSQCSLELVCLFKSFVVRKVSTLGSRFATVRFTTVHFLRPVSSRTEHSLLVVQHCHNSSVLSLLSALVALFRCASVSSFSTLVQFF
jgi:hypothetical protein